MEIRPSARKHGVSDDDMRHALRWEQHRVVREDGTRVVYGPDFTGRLLELGVRMTDEGPVIFHAMPARTRPTR